jgi:hypothetical protein
MQAPAAYSELEENFFRRELENFILNSLSYVLSVARATDTQASLTQKRRDYNLPIGKAGGSPRTYSQ